MISHRFIVPTFTYKAPIIYSYEFVIHDNGNINQQDVLMLQKLELATIEDSYSGQNQSDKKYSSITLKKERKYGQDILKKGFNKIPV